MKNRGFTLVELLGVISILAIIGAIVFPIVSNVINKGLDDTDNAQTKSIEKAAKNWANANMFSNDLPKCNTDICNSSISVSNLITEGYLDSDDIISPKTGESYKCSSVKITKDAINNKYSFDFQFQKCEN